MLRKETSNEGGSSLVSRLKSSNAEKLFQHERLLINAELRVKDSLSLLDFANSHIK
jgi:hypothetical protein